MKCIVIGVNHYDQEKDTENHDLERRLCEILDDNRGVELIAEERFPNDGKETVPERVATGRRIRRTSVDMPVEIREQRGIADALKGRIGPDLRRKVIVGCYLNREDGCREEYWIDQIVKDGAEMLR